MSAAGAALALSPVVDPQAADLLKAKFGLHHPGGSEPRPSKFIWGRGDVLPLAWNRCSFCFGAGVQLCLPGEPCRCVTRRIFRELMYQRYKSLLRADFISRCRPEVYNGGGGARSRWTFSRPNEEFIADLQSLAYRTLDHDHLAAWRLYHCDERPWRDCGAILKIAKGELYHRVYRVEQQLGRAARELLPYPLYPIDQYFSQ